MREIQSWVFNLCTISVLVSVLLTFIKNDKANSGIKTVLALYILVSTLNPLLNNKYAAEDFTVIENNLINPINTQAIIEEQTLKNIITNFDMEFKASNISANCKKVELSEDLQKIVSVELILNDESDKSKAISLAKTLAGEKAEIIVQKEG